MRKLAGAAIAALALLALGSNGARSQNEEASLQPYQMVRSLQLVQDRIAGGDHAALPMQKKLLEMIDARFRDAGNAGFEDPRNFRALMIYAMSGGNPATIAELLSRMEVGTPNRDMGAAVLGYLLGDLAQARTAMKSIDPNAHPQELAAFLSLVKGSVLSTDDAKAGLAFLDKARLLGPGTLVEEAALRRTVTLAVAARDAQKFLSASEQYARRYLRSPYSSQFAEAFVSGIIELNGLLDIPRIEQSIAWMTQEQARTVYLRLARRAAIDGDAELLAFASKRASDYAAGGSDVSDARSELYASISSVTSETVEEVLARLQTLDPTRLSANDRALLTAAKAVANEVVAPVAPVSAVPAAFSPQQEPPIGAPAAPPAQLNQDQADDFIAATRSRLDAIDSMLKENMQ